MADYSVNQNEIFEFTYSAKPPYMMKNAAKAISARTAEHLLVLNSNSVINVERSYHNSFLVDCFPR